MALVRILFPSRTIFRAPAQAAPRHGTFVYGFHVSAPAIADSAAAAWRRGVGVELLGEVKLLYAIGLQLRLGVARALDDAKGTHGYLTLGRAF